MTASASSAARRFLVRGRVQGVGFRWSAVAEGNRLGLGGWARDRADGRVEVHAQGDPAAVGELAAWLRRGPLGAEVTSVDEVPAEPEPGLTAFEFRG